MQSNNPVFRNADGFNKPSYNAYGNATYAGNGSTHAGYGQTDPSQWSVGQPGVTGAPADTGARMSVDTVVQKTAISVLLVIVAAAATWVLTPSIAGGMVDAAPLAAAAAIGGIGAFALSMINSFKKSISPVLVMAFAIFEGVAIGAVSKLIDAQVGQGVVVQAVIGTFAASAGTLAAYKFFHIKVGQRFRTFVTAAMFGMVGLAVMEMVLGYFGHSTGLFGFGGLGIITAAAGLVLGVLMLVMDFDFVERGVANGLPERESWRAAFAITVSLVWIYMNLLRLLAILQRN